ncbi:hypothetical protein BU14_0393s0024 [Porphyra umbilicalis]|uniref:Uncharacterized protein n=1 Tax=Porphyra umbilicalis TaxID=2786 RepID=A0A1X6NWQ1_PORUM|nr:hypothetical protein BU14_0393s0024 [Porphyra umbilicalis]|eukprot:OSX72936.1 hypothetical protein BU14_0393s0024 [Porphyra umbilicalis]
MIVPQPLVLAGHTSPQHAHRRLGPPPVQRLPRGCVGRRGRARVRAAPFTCAGWSPPPGRDVGRKPPWPLAARGAAGHRPAV